MGWARTCRGRCRSRLGLDSLMAVRIKNTASSTVPTATDPAAVRDANLYNVEKLIEYAVEHRDEVQQLHEHQARPLRRSRGPRPVLHGKIRQDRASRLGKPEVARSRRRKGEQYRPTGRARVDAPRDCRAGHLRHLGDRRSKVPGGIFNW